MFHVEHRPLFFSRVFLMFHVEHTLGMDMLPLSYVSDI